MFNDIYNKKLIEKNVIDESLTLLWFQENRKRLLKVAKKWSEHCEKNSHWKHLDNRLNYGKISKFMESEFDEISFQNKGGRIKHNITTKIIACKSGEKDGDIFVTNPMITINPNTGTFERQWDFDYLLYIKRTEPIYIGICDLDYILENYISKNNKIKLKMKPELWPILIKRIKKGN